MRLETLTEDEGRLVHDPSDEIYLSLIKGASNEEMSEFMKYSPIDMGHYMKIQKDWIEEEKYLVGVKICHNPTNAELIEDFNINKNGPRFRMYYCLKYPGRIKRNK